MAWLAPDELRVGLGCMRLSTDADRDEARAEATVREALGAGVTVFDTARAYGLGDDDLGHNERLLARVLGGEPRARVVTKGGMRRPSGGWLPDGRAGALRADCEASLEALGGLPIDLYLLHAPDPRVPWATSVRALRGLLDEGLVRRVGVCNVSRAQLDEALDVAPLAAAQVALSLVDDAALRAGVVARCRERGVALLCHSPLGGRERARALLRRHDVRAAASEVGATPAQAALAALLTLGDEVAGEAAGGPGEGDLGGHARLEVIVLPGARRPEAAREAAGAARVRLAASDFGGLRARRDPPRPALASDGASDEVVLIMGLQGAGKSERARALAEQGYLRLCRDDEGGTLRALAARLAAALANGQRRVVVDGTLLTRAARRDFLAAAAGAGVPVRGLWLDTPTAEAQVNVVLRMLAAHGRLLAPDELRRGKDPTSLGPTAIFRALREREAPSLDEGFSSLEGIAFARRAAPAGARPGRFVHLDALLGGDGRLRPDAAAIVAGADAGQGGPRLIFGWRPQGAGPSVAALMEELAGRGAPPVELALCDHPAGPPVCWCRPPLPGLLLAFALRHGVDPAASMLVGDGAANRTLAAAVGARLELAKRGA